jgi:hypothetical protein
MDREPVWPLVAVIAIVWAFMFFVYLIVAGKLLPVQRLGGVVLTLNAR